MEAANLTFKELNDRIEALPDHPSLSIAPTKRQRWGYVIGFSAGFTALIGIKLLPNTFATGAFAAILLTVEIIALGIACIPWRPWTLPGFTSERRDFADQLDFDRHHYDELIAWLCKHPREQLEAMAKYAADRHERLKEKHPLFTGGIDKLGALPVVAALYLQFKDLHWPPHPTWPEILLGIALVGFYWGGLLLVSVRFRAQNFEVLLRRAVEQKGQKLEK